MLGGTAARVYGFDVDALAPIAARIGPTPADLGQDPTLRGRSRGSEAGSLVEGRPRAAGQRD